MCAGAVAGIELDIGAVSSIGAAKVQTLVEINTGTYRLRDYVIDPFLCVGIVTSPQLDVVAVVGVAAVEVDAQFLVIAHFDGQSVKIPLLVFIGIILGPQLDVGAPFGAGM